MFVWLNVEVPWGRVPRYSSSSLQKTWSVSVFSPTIPFPQPLLDWSWLLDCIHFGNSGWNFCKSPVPFSERRFAYNTGMSLPQTDWEPSLPFCLYTCTDSMCKSQWYHFANHFSDVSRWPYGSLLTFDAADRRPQLNYRPTRHPVI